MWAYPVEIRKGICGAGIKLRLLARGVHGKNNHRIGAFMKKAWLFCLQEVPKWEVRERQGPKYSSLLGLEMVE